MPERNLMNWQRFATCVFGGGEDPAIRRHLQHGESARGCARTRDSSTAGYRHAFVVGYGTVIPGRRI